MSLTQLLGLPVTAARQFRASNAVSSAGAVKLVWQQRTSDFPGDFLNLQVQLGIAIA
jgi:hypothetical protein